MICKSCGSEFDIENFDLCPYCLSPVELGDKSLDKVNLKEVKEEIHIEAKIEESESEDSSLNAIEAVVDVVEKEERKINPVDLPIEKLNLSVRAYNVLKRNEINTMDDLLRFMEEKSLHDVRNAGTKTIGEIEHVVKQYQSGGLTVIEIGYEEEKESAEVFPFINMSCDVENMSIHAFSELGLTKQSTNLLMKHGWKVCGEFKKISATEIVKIVRKNNFDKILQVASWLENDIITLLQRFLDNTANERDGRIFLRRSMGDTLQNIADTPENDDSDTLTRERVRQIEKKYCNRILPFVKVIIDLLSGNDDYVLTQDLLEIYDNDDYDRIIIHACKFLEEYQYLDFADMFVKKKDTKDIEVTIMQTLSDYIGAGIDICDNLEEIYLMFAEIGFGYLDIEAIKNLLRKYGYHIYGDYVSKSKVSYGVLCMQVVKKYFPLGIKLSQNDIEKSEDLLKLRELVKKKFSGLELPDSDRALSATLSRCGLVLRGRGIYIPEECIEIDESVLSEIKLSIDSKPEGRVFYSELYSEFEGVLNFTCGIDNHNYLHGVLMKYYPTVYEYSRDYLLKNGVSDSLAETIADRIYNFICEMGRPVEKKELMQKFQGFSNVMIISPFVNDKRLLQWEYNYYTCTGILHIDQGDEEILRQLLLDVLEENEGYSSDAMLYRRVKNAFPEFLEKNRIVSDMNLYYIVNMMFDNICDFRRPHIGIKGKFEKFSTKDVVLHMMSYPDELSYEKYRMIADAMEWSPVTTGIVFGEIEKEYVRISDDIYIRDSSFMISDNNKIIIRKKLELLMEDGVLPLMNIDMDEFPDIEYQWNEFLLETIIQKLFDDIVIIHPAIRDRRYQKGIAVLKEKGIDCYSQVVAYKMEQCGIDAMPESQFLSFLVVQNLTKKMIPNELSNSDYIKKDGEFYIRVV